MNQIESKAVRATLTDSQLIEKYESEIYNKDLSERELISMALELYFSEQNEKRIGVS